MSDYLKKEEYEEPQCLLNMRRAAEAIPINRVMDRLDSYLDRNDHASAERHLRYWLGEAEAAQDKRGMLTVLNEQIGLYRKLGREAEGLQAIARVLPLIGQLHMENTVTHGTTLINAATGYKAFGKAAEALPLYEQARNIYEAALDPADGRLGGLYNNTALALMELGRFREAETLFDKALAVMEKQEHGEPEMAITLLNLADLVSAEIGAENGKEKIEACLRRAEALLNTESLPRNGYYAFVCEKCAPVFGYYGFFPTELELTVRAREIYERS